MIRTRLLRLHQKLRNRVYDAWVRHGFPDHAEQLRQAQLRCDEAQADVEPELWNHEKPWSKDNDYIVKEVEKPAWVLKTRRGPEEVPYSFVPEPEPAPAPSDLEKFIMDELPETPLGAGHQGSAVAGYEFEAQMLSGCLNQDGDADGNCPGREDPDNCDRIPDVFRCPLKEEQRV